MKINTRLLLLSLSLMLLLSVTAYAALPVTVQPRWQNINSMTCGIMVITGQDEAIAEASIVGYTGSTVSANVTLYKIKNGYKTVVYADSTPANHSLPYAIFSYEFIPESGATYFLSFDAIVTRNGVDEGISDSDIVTFP